MKVQSSVRMPSPRLRSFTRRITRKSRKKVIEMREFSSAFWKPLAQRQELQQHGRNRGPGPQRMLRRELTALFLVLVPLPGPALLQQPREGPTLAKPVLSPMVVWLIYGGLSWPSASPFRLPGLLGIRDVLYYKPLHRISSLHWKDAILL